MATCINESVHHLPAVIVMLVKLALAQRARNCFFVYFSQFVDRLSKSQISNTERNLTLAIRQVSKEVSEYVNVTFAPLDPGSP